MQLLDDPFLVPLLVVVGAKISVLHSEAHRVVEEDGDLAGCCSHCLGLADTRCQATVERTQCRVGLPNRHRCQSKERGHPVGSLARVRRQHFAAADLAAWRQRQA